MNRMTAGKGERAKGKGDGKRRRRRLVLVAVIVVGLAAWLISTAGKGQRAKGKGEGQQMTAYRGCALGGGVAPLPLALCPLPEVGELPDEPFQRCATKALRGDYGALAEWQRVGYQLGLDQGVTATTMIWATQYFPAEGYHYGETTASGYPCSLRVAAATAIPLFAFVWTEPTGIRQVLDTGASWNDDVARRKGASCWVDFWTWREGDYGFSTRVMEAAVILRAARAA